MNGNEAGEHPDEDDMLRDQMNSGIAFIRAGKARLKLACPVTATKSRAPTGWRFRAFVKFTRSLL